MSVFNWFRKQFVTKKADPISDWMKAEVSKAADSSKKWAKIIELESPDVFEQPNEEEHE